MLILFFFLFIYLALDGWTSGAHKSIWNFIILTPERKEYLHSLSDFSINSHTSDFLASKITEVINKVGCDRFAAIVSDNAANVKKARELVQKDFPKIQSVRCIAHCINLLAGDIVSHSFADRLLTKVNTLASYFKNTSRSGNNKLIITSVDL